MERNQNVLKSEEYKRNFFKKEVLRTLIMEGMTIDYAGDGVSELSLKITDKMLNTYSKVHGGILFTLSDYAAGSCAYEMGKAVVTLNANINFIKAVNTQEIIAKGKAVHSGKSTVVVNVETIDKKTGELLSTSSFTMFVIGDAQDFI